MESNDVAATFAALSQATRIDLLRLLIAEGSNGLPAGELVSRLGLPNSTVSFHLAALERVGLTQSTRRGRQVLHAARIARLRTVLTFLTEACCGGRPDLCGDLAYLLPPAEEETGMTPAFNVLFLCTHNSARSIMAEAILQKIGGTRFNAYSAGSDPVAAPNPEVMAKLMALGHDVSLLRSKDWHQFTGPEAPRMDFVITLCDTLRGQSCPDFGELAITAAWPLPDPVKFSGSAVERSTMLNELYASLHRRLSIFTALPFAALDRMAMKARLDEIGSGLPALARGR
ncbi:MAG: metalloregulator ArsR/SmtB family transcription factor [Rhodospirillales bacterium]|nr:metalloregulator ArsR/SmtB family transcription factor [Rhodospirillales bacterium]